MCRVRRLKRLSLITRGEWNRMLCYRYMGFQNAKWSLEDCWYKTSRPSEFNDPFDCRINVIGVPPDKVVEECIDRNFQRLRTQVVLKHPEWAKVNIGRKLMFEKLRLCADWANEVMSQMRNGCEDMARIICFSLAAVEDEGVDNLMWGHYADKGSGIRIGFELDDSNIGNPYVLKRVCYEKAIPAYDLSKLRKWPNVRSPDNDFLLKCIFTKDQSWAYEKEVRMLIPRKGPLFEPLFQERRIGGNCLDFYRLPYAAIRTVDFGVRANIEQCKKLMTTIRRNDNTQHIVFRKAEYRDDIYGYKFVEL